MAHTHSPGFLAIVQEAKRAIREMSIDDYRRRLAAGEKLILIDVREDREWDKGRLPGAIHLGKGVIERDIEKTVPDKNAAIVCQCGGGFRSALVCENLQRMGYTNTWSLDGGYRGWTEAGLAVEKDATAESR
jgi:rhodanese-related sulfurtransferase